MKTTQIVMSLALALTLGLAPMAVARADMDSNAPATPAQKQPVSGAVTNVDSVNQTIQVKDANGQIQTFAVSPDIEITKNQEKVSLSDIKVGDVVTIKMTKSNSNS